MDRRTMLIKKSDKGYGDCEIGAHTDRIKDQ